MIPKLNVHVPSQSVTTRLNEITVYLVFEKGTKYLGLYWDVNLRTYSSEYLLFPCKFISGAPPPANQNGQGGSESSKPEPERGESGKYLQGDVIHYCKPHILTVQVPLALPF